MRENDEKETIAVSSFASFIMGDMRRPSFVKGATDRALQAFGVTHKSIFTGDWALKKMGNDSFYKKRFIWVDISDNTFHWCKVQDRSSPHKRIKLSKVNGCHIGPPAYSSFLEGRHIPELCWSLECDSGRTIDIKMNDEGKVNEWVKVIAIILNNSRGDIGVEGGNEPIIQAVDVVT